MQGKRPLSAGRALLTVALAGFAGAGAAQDKRTDIDFTTRDGQAKAALSALGYAVVPAPYSSLFTVERTQNSELDFRNGQLGGGRVPIGWPIYIEGFIAYQSYEPDFVVGGGEDDATVRWRSFAATGGVGWNFQLSDDLALRPILNVSLGRIVSNDDAPVAGDEDFIAGGGLTAGGYGGALLLAYSGVEGVRELDFQARYSQMRLVPLGEWSDTETSATAVTTAALGRLRTPIPFLPPIRGGPVRAVYEGSIALFTGDQTEFLDIPWLARAGLGLEIETGWRNPDRARVMVRYVFGESFSGITFGGALQF